jgi:hypothetical protein
MVCKNLDRLNIKCDIYKITSMRNVDLAVFNSYDIIFLCYSTCFSLASVLKFDLLKVLYKNIGKVVRVFSDADSTLFFMRDLEGNTLTRRT